MKKLLLAAAIAITAILVYKRLKECVEFDIDWEECGG